MPNPFGSRYGRPKRGDLLRGAQLGVRVRSAEADKPAAVKLTPTRRGCLEAIGADRVKWHPSAGWRCDGKGVSAVVRDCVTAGWVREWVADGRLHVELTDLGRKAIGEDEPA